MTQVPDPKELQAADRQRLEFLEVVSNAISRRSEILQLCYGARDPDEAVAAIARLLDVSEQAALAVTDLQFRRLTESARLAIDAQVRDIRERLRDQ